MSRCCFSEIDPVQNNAVSAAVNTAGFSETTVWSGQPGGCGNPSFGDLPTCYPPAVNYTPAVLPDQRSRVQQDQRLGLAVPDCAGHDCAGRGTTGSVLVRMVNAGLRMHVPSIVGSQIAGQTGATTPAVPGFTLIAEDGNPLPGIPRVQSEVFMAAGKTYDVMINVTRRPALPLPRCDRPAVFDRELSLSGNATERDAGMLAYISINGAGTPTVRRIAAAVASADTYNALVAGADAHRVGSIQRRDRQRHQCLWRYPACSGNQRHGDPQRKTARLLMFPTGTATSDSFSYCANGTVTGTTCSSGITATVTLGAANITDTAGVTCTGSTFNANTSTYVAIKTPGVLAIDKDAAGYPLTVVTTSASQPAAGLTVAVDPNGGFNATSPAPARRAPTASPTRRRTRRGRSAPRRDRDADLPGGERPHGDGCGRLRQDHPDHRLSLDHRGRPHLLCRPQLHRRIRQRRAARPPVRGSFRPLGTNFHTSYMPVVAQGCTGPLSCEAGQTVFNPPLARM